MASQSFSDQMGNSIAFSDPPQRIISLVPSQTELLASLALDKEVVGITKFCIHPSKWLKSKSIVGGTKKVDVELIKALSPDLIIGNKEENDKETIETLRRIYPVWMSDITNLSDAIHMIASIGEITSRQCEAQYILTTIQDKFKDIRKFEGQSVLYLIWKNPWMGVGKNTFIDSMLTLLGLSNVLAAHDRYPVLSNEDIQALRPQFILLSSEPFPFAQKHVVELKTIAPWSEIILVDGEMFSWYGSRLIKAADYFATLELS
jgi:ABC-type Fe3+-hydroxamate transport system substrate-binding protein